MSFAQQRLWFLDQFELGNSTYNITWAIRFQGRLDIPALEKSLNTIAQRHEVLRATFTTINDEPVQVIPAFAPIAVLVTDVGGKSANESQAEVLRIAREESARVVDLRSGPLFRARLLRTQQDDHTLLISIHHIIFDRWSRGIFFRELTVLYTAFRNGAENSLPELPLQYTDYSVWQRKTLRGQTLEKQLGYWRQHLGGCPSSLDLPTDRPRPALQSFRGATYSFEFPAELTRELTNLSRHEGVTLFMTLLAGFQTLLSRYASQDDIVVGTPIANRNRAEIENLIGFFANTLALRTDLSGDPTFLELLARVREVA